MTDTAIRTKADRIYYLDNIRIFCMVFGIYYHAAALGEYALLDKIFGLSVVFRMETFFLVSGFFVSSLLERKNEVSFIKQRTLVLVVPFISTLIIINPITIYLSYGYNNSLSYGSYSIADVFNDMKSWQHGGPELHLWFLLVLLLYTYIFIIIRNYIKNIAAWCDMHNSSLLTSPIFFSIMYGLFMTFFMLASRRIEFPRLAFPFMEDLPYFLIGALAGYSKTIIDKVTSFKLSLLILGVAGWCMVEYYRGPGWGPVGSFGKGLLSVAIVIMINWTFSTFFKGTSHFAKVLSSTIYTVYLFHQFFLIAIVAAFGMHRGDLKTIQMLLLATLVTIIGVVLHVGVVDRSPTLSFLFSGKKKPMARLLERSEG